MLNKKNDIPYLNCSVDKIKKAEPVINTDALNHLYEYITQRYSIYKKRLAGESPPWTNNELLQKYSFTNLRREHDRTSLWLINNISNNSDIRYEDSFWRSLLFRFYNKIETAELIKLDSKEFWSKSNLDNALTSLSEQTIDVFTRAYKSVGLRVNLGKLYPDYNYRCAPLLYISDLREKYGEDLPESVEDNANETVKWLRTIPGVGDFISYQLFVDLTYMSEFPISENEFVMAGPGCKTGLDMLFDYRASLSYEELLFWLRDNLEGLFKYINIDFFFYNLYDNLEEHDRCINVMTLENIFCEFGKYIYLMTGKHKRPRKYIQR